MLDGFSAEARRAVALASAEARRLAHPHIGTEHLLLGLLSEETPTSLALHEAGASLAAARHKVMEAAGGGAGGLPPVDLALTPRAQRALERAGRFSRQDREPLVRTDHVLLGVLDVEGLACQVLRGLGVDLTRLRAGLGPDRADTTARLRAGSVADVADATDADPAPSPEAQPTPAPRCPACATVLDDMLVASELTGRDETGSPVAVRVVSCAACGTALGVLPPTG